MHKITRLVIALAILLFALVMFANLPDQLLLFPTTKPLNPRGAARKTLPFDHGELEVWIAQSKRARLNGTPETYVVRFYGNADRADARSEEHTSELQSRFDLVCRLLLEKKKKKKNNRSISHKRK